MHSHRLTNTERLSPLFVIAVFPCSWLLSGRFFRIERDYLCGWACNLAYHFSSFYWSSISWPKCVLFSLVSSRVCLHIACLLYDYWFGIKSSFLTFFALKPLSLCALCMCSSGIAASVYIFIPQYVCTSVHNVCFCADYVHKSNRASLITYMFACIWVDVGI